MDALREAREQGRHERKRNAAVFLVRRGGRAALVAQNIGRTGPISPAPGGSPWASLLGVALLLAGISVAVAVVSTRHGMRWLSRGWAASFLLFSLIAAYSLWRLA
jgi:hypothetical protein